jgi:hypothetical protein
MINASVYGKITTVLIALSVRLLQRGSYYQNGDSFLLQQIHPYLQTHMAGTIRLENLYFGCFGSEKL